MANVLSRQDQTQILKMLCEGCSLRTITRLTGIHRTTVMNLMVRFGDRCRTFLDRTLRNLFVTHLECDEIWTFCGKKQGKMRPEEQLDETRGDQFLYIAQDNRSKLICCYALGKRNREVTQAFMADLAQRILLPDPGAPLHVKPMISTDGWQAYPNAVMDNFGFRVRYGQIVKTFSNAEQPGRYGAPLLMATKRRSVWGIDDLHRLTTSHVERNNLTIRTFMRRFTRLSLGFSKKLANLAACIAIHVAYFNFCWRPRQNKGGKLRPTPAMMANLTPSVWSFDDLYDAVMA